jgi:hypothetical protein
MKTGQLKAGVTIQTNDQADGSSDGMQGVVALSALPSRARNSRSSPARKGLDFKLRHYLKAVRDIARDRILDLPKAA